MSKSSEDPRKKIKEWWENPSTISLLDENLRILETDFVLPYLSKNMDMADFGCGGGESTAKYAAKVNSLLALEQSKQLRTRAKQRFKEDGLDNVTLVKGDVMDLSAYPGRFHVAVTQRVVINFMSWEEQKQVIRNIHDSLRPGGLYLAIENTHEGFEAMNSVRRDVGLDNILMHDWHNYFLHYDRFMDYVEGMFVVEKEHTFNLYYLLTRVFENMFAKFEGFGSNAVKDDIFTIADQAARKLYEVMGDRITFDVPKGTSFGPIQGFVLRKIS
ncbi:MAG: class I SAM-dependent methyltransferase [Magnetococcales bacterium]|nr:class I SAM-dependent methyltransferase [Magnetococcales bacterium]